MFVKDLMTREFQTIQIEHTIQETLHCFTKIQSNIIPVINSSGILIGIITKNKIIHALANGASQTETIESMVNHEPIYIFENDLIIETRNLLLSYRIGHAPVVNQDMKPIGILSTTQILFGYEQQFDHMQSRLSLLFSNLNFGLISVDTKMNVNAFNPFAEQFLKFPHESLRKDIFIEHEGISSLLKQVLIYGEKDANMKISLNGYSLLMRCYPLIERNQIIGAMLLIENMTQLERTVEALEFSKEWEEKLRSVIELAYDGLIIVNQKGEITMVNDGFCELFNTTQNKLINYNVKDIYPQLAIHDVLKSGIKMNNVAKMIGTTQCLITVLPIHDEDEMIGAVCKITYRGLKHLQEALNRVTKLEKQVTYYQKELQERKGTKYSFANIIGDSPIIQKVKKEAFAASQSLSTVLLLGESGTGKELFASGIHVASKRNGKFIQVNCAAIPADLLESELFGYSEGAFTGAKKGGKKGKFELAQNGTLFLDEIGDMPLLLQTKLLRVLQEKEFEPIGSNQVLSLNTKIIAATNQNLQHLIADNQFREDLFYRLNVMNIHIPPLRDRKEDIQDITEAIIEQLNQAGFSIKGVTHYALTKLLQHEWPGNIRELYNALERAANLTIDGYIDASNLPNFQQTNELPSIKPPNQTIVNHESMIYKEALETKEKQLIENALIEANGNKAKASRILGISRTWLYTQMKKYNIQH